MTLFQCWDVNQILYDRSEDISIVILNCNEKHVKELYMCYNESTIQSKA
jgi:hypothetical protein